MNTLFYAVPERSNPNALSARLAGKLVAIILAITLVLGILLCGAGKAFATSMPRTDIVVKSENIRLGDVFEGVARNGDFVLAPAPAPGEELVWNAPTLMRIATAFNLPWRPAKDDAVKIRRAAARIDAATLRSVVNDHLTHLDEQDSFDVSITSEVPDIVVPTIETPSVELADFDMSPQGGAFSAIIRITGDEGKVQNVNLRGMAERMARVPVLRRTLRNGSIIAESDITWVEKPATSVRSEIIRDTAELVGATPRKVIGAGSFIRADDLQQPLLISRGDIVTMVFEQAGMHLTARGRALDNGTMGQVIKVSNVGSNRQLEARVTARKQVTVNQ